MSDFSLDRACLFFYHPQSYDQGLYSEELTYLQENRVSNNIKNIYLQLLLTGDWVQPPWFPWFVGATIAIFVESMNKVFP
jgi:hypothetical protein